MVPSGSPIQVVLATDSFLLGDGLASMLESDPDVVIVGRAKDHFHLVSLVDDLHPDAVIYGIRTAVVTTMATISVARHLRTEYPSMGFVVISDRGRTDSPSNFFVGARRESGWYLLDQNLPNIDTVLASLRGRLSGRIGARSEDR